MKQLVNIQNELKVPKGNFNSFGKYKYRSAEDILEAVKPILLKYNATLILSDDVIGSSNKQFIKATAILSIESDSITATGFAELSEHKGMSAEQCTGTASSYARKYALNGLFLIDETESDSDNEQVKPAPAKKPILEPKTFEAMIEAINNGKGKQVEDSLHKYEATPQQLTAIKTALKNNG